MKVSEKCVISSASDPEVLQFICGRQELSNVPKLNKKMRRWDMIALESIIIQS